MEIPNDAVITVELIDIKSIESSIESPLTLKMNITRYYPRYKHSIRYFKYNPNPQESSPRLLGHWDYKGEYQNHWLPVSAEKVEWLARYLSDEIILPWVLSKDVYLRNMAKKTLELRLEGVK